MSRRPARTKNTSFVSFFILLVLLTALPAFARAAAVGEFPIAPAQTQSGINAGLAADPAGNIWFTDSVSEQVARITPAGQVTMFNLFFPGRLTGGITAGPDGNIWFTKEFPGLIIRITPGDTVVEFPVFPIDSPSDITVGADGNLWFTGGNQIGRMTPLGEVTLFSPPTPSSSPQRITAGPDGNLWFTETAAGKIGRTTPEGVITEFVVPGQAQPIAIAAGPDGNLWFTDGPDIGRITPAGAVTKFLIPGLSSSCYGIIAGPDGNLWFAVNNRNTIGRITTAGAFLPELALPTAAAAPQKIVASPDGLLWFTESSTNKIGTISLEELTGYFPLTAGTSWTYQKNGAAGFTRNVASVDGTGVARIVFSDGYEMYMSSDANGIRDHAEVEPGFGTLSFDPPIVFADSRSAPGVPTFGSGTAFIDGYHFSEYISNSTVDGFETITVPAGTFRTVRLSTTVDFGGGLSASQTNWVAGGVGVVKEMSEDDYGIATYLLTATSIRDATPDRFVFHPRFFQAPGAIATSNTVTVTGITAAAPISISGGEYRIGSGAFTASPGTVINGQTVTVRQAASSAFETSTTALLTIGGFSTPFRLTTWPRPAGAELSRAIAVLRLLAGMAVPDGQLPPDATGDGKAGLAEALLILQQFAGLRR